jgi:hypothetical protein
MYSDNTYGNAYYVNTIDIGTVENTIEIVNHGIKIPSCRISPSCASIAKGLLQRTDQDPREHVEGLRNVFVVLAG